MALVNVLARLLLAATFFVAGAAKLRDRDGSRRALKAFGVPSPLVSLAAGVLPLAELTAAALLLTARTAVWGAATTLALLLAFLVAIIVNLVRGRTPECNCFGQISATPISWSTVARNSVLASISVLILLTPQASLTLASLARLVDPRGLLIAAGTAAFGLETFLLFELFRQQGRLLLRIDSIEQRLASAGPSSQVPQPQTPVLTDGDKAPEFAARTATHESVDLAGLLGRHRTLVLIFSDPACGACVAVLNAVKVWQPRFAERLTIAVITRRAAGKESPDALDGLQNILFQDGREISESYGVYGTPAAVLVRPDGTIRGSVAFGKAAIEALLRARPGRAPAAVSDITREIAV